MGKTSSSDLYPVGEPVPLVDAKPPQRAPIQGRWITLRPLQPAADVTDLYATSHGNETTESLWTYMAYGPFESETAMHQWLEECSRSDDPLFYTVVANATSRPLGMASLQRFTAAAGCVELAHIWYGPEHQRTRVNTEMTYLALTEAFERMGCRRVEWKCDALNHRSRAAALRLGFSFEGTFKQHMIIKGRNRDTAWYAMLDKEWPGKKRHFETALFSETTVSLSELNRS